jgi:cell wall-associated NlpC family hydrolase
MPVTQAAQAVQRSAFPNAYAKWQPFATQIVADPTVLSADCYVSAAFTSDGTAGGAAVASALSQIGVPYSWGGGSLTGPSAGFGSGAGVVGFDCSSLVQYAWHQAGFDLPRVASAQATSVTPLPLEPSAWRPGDLVFFHAPADPPGFYHHVGIYDGQGGLVHAPRPGLTVEVVHDFLSVPFFHVELAVVGRPTGDLDDG